MRPDLNQEAMEQELASKYNELPEDLKIVYKEKANQILEEFKNNNDPACKLLEKDVEQTANVMEEILEGVLKKKVKVEQSPSDEMEEASKSSAEKASSTQSLNESLSKSLNPENGSEEMNEVRNVNIGSDKSDMLRPSDERETSEKKEDEKRKLEAPTTKTHEALSKAGKKGAAKRWGKKYDEDLNAEEKMVEEQKPKPFKQKAGIDPEISEAFSKIGHLGGKARGGEDKKSNIDFKTHDALSKAGKMGAAKRWGQQTQGEPKKMEQSHVQTRSHKSSHTSSESMENDVMTKEENSAQKNLGTIEEF